MYSIAWWQLMLGGPLSTAWQNSNRQSKDMTCIQPHHFLWLQHFLQDLGLDCCYEYALGAAHVTILLKYDWCSPWTWTIWQQDYMWSDVQASHRHVACLNNLVTIEQSFWWWSWHSHIFEILGIKEEFLYLRSPMFHQWRSGALANGLPLLSCQVIGASRLRALVGNWFWLTDDPENGSCRPYRKIDLFTP